VDVEGCRARPDELTPLQECSRIECPHSRKLRGTFEGQLLADRTHSVPRRFPTSPPRPNDLRGASYALALTRPKATCSTRMKLPEPSDRFTPRPQSESGRAAPGADRIIDPPDE
jgi:hypothetical protein